MSDYIATFDASIARNLSAQYREDSYEHDIQDVFVEINNACHNGDNCVFFRKYICKDAINKLRALGYSVQYDQKDGGFNIWWQFAKETLPIMKGVIFVKNFNGEIIIRPREVDKHTIESIGNSIHQQLVGNQDYIDSNIGISLETDSVIIWFDNCKEEIPDIVF